MAKTKKRAAVDAPEAGATRESKKRKSAAVAMEKLVEMREAEEEMEEAEEEADEEMVVAANGKCEEEAEEPAPEGYAHWKTTSKLMSGEKLMDETSTISNLTWQHTQEVEVNFKEKFILKPLIIMEGSLKGHHVLVVHPVAPKKKAKTFRFLDLPAEIRTMIYGHLFNETGEITIDTYKPPHQPRRAVRSSFRSKYWATSHAHKQLEWDAEIGKWLGQKPCALTILGVCKLVLQEAAPIIYGDNTFVFSRPIKAGTFLDGIGQMRKHVRAIEFRGREGGMSKISTVFSMLKDANQLRTITFPHHAVCGAFYRWGGYWSKNGIYTARRLCGQLGPLVKALRKVQKKEGREHQVLELIQIREHLRRCDSCLRDRECDHINATFCRTQCDDLEAHSKEFMKECKALIAKKLRIKIDEDSDEESEGSNVV